MKKTLLTSCCLALRLCILVSALGFHTSATAQSGEPALEAPVFSPPGFPVYEKDILLGFYNPNTDSETEIHISRLPDDGFSLLHIAGPGETIYYDSSLSPRTTYYFKLRAIRYEEEPSPYSAVTSYTTGSKFYYPVLKAEAMGTTIELTFYDRSYDDNSYDIWRELGSNATLLTTLSLSDSGQVITITDADRMPNTTYRYRVDAHTKGPNNPFYNAVATASAQTLSGPLVTGFTLVDPASDEDLMELNDQDFISPAGNPNIRANTNDETSSVIFFLNGVQRTENEAPYAYFHDSKGDYRPGKLTSGHYILEATAYSGNNGSGIRGNTLSIEFFVDDINENLEVHSFTLVDPDTDEDIGTLNDGDVVDAGMLPNIRANAGPETESVVFYLNGIERTENQEPYAYFYDNNGDYRPGGLAPGENILEATAFSRNNGQGTGGNTHSIRFTVVESTMASVNLFPNPVVSYAELSVRGEAGSPVMIDLADEYGGKRRAIHKGFLNDAGYLATDLKVDALPRGNYLLLIRVNGRSVAKRFLVE